MGDPPAILSPSRRLEFSYNLCAAKYMAESSASLVGKNTFLWELGPEGPTDTHSGTLSILDLTRAAWERGKPSMPNDIEATIKGILSAPSDEKT